MKQGAQKRGARQVRTTQKDVQAVYATGCFSDIFANLQNISTTLEILKSDHANQGLALFDNLIHGLNMLRSQLKTSKLFNKGDKDSFKNSVTMFTKITIEHMLNGWYMHISPADHLAVFKGFIAKLNQILLLLEEIKNTVSASKDYSPSLKKFFSDMIAHFRLFKTGYNLNVINAMSHGLREKPEYALELYALLEAAKMEHAYLEIRIPQTDKENKLFSGGDSFLKQNYFAMLNALADIYAFDPVTKQLLEFINPKKLLPMIESCKDDNTLFHRLSLCITMAKRLNTLSSFQLAFGYLDFYFKNIERFMRIRAGTNLVIMLAKRKDTVIQVVDTIYLNLVNEFKTDSDFSVHYANFKIIQAIIGLNGGNDSSPNNTTFQTVKDIFQARKEKRELELKALLDTHKMLTVSQLQITDAKAHYFLNQIDSIKQFTKMLKKRGCKVKFKLQENTIRTKNLHRYLLKDIEIFCSTYAELKVASAPVPEMQAITEQFADCAINEERDNKKVITGREYLKLNPPKPQKEKTKGTSAPVVVRLDSTAQENASCIRSEKVVRLFGEQYKDKKVYRCHMKSGIDSYYVCLGEESKNTKACTQDELQDFATLFVDARQALNKKDFGFKISHIQSTGEVSLCAKKGYLRSYPQSKIISQADKSKILFLYNSIVKKDSKQEKHHVMNTIKPISSDNNKKLPPKIQNQKKKKK